MVLVCCAPCSRNVFLKNGQAKVGDFGLSKRIETTSEDQANVLDGKANDGKYSCTASYKKRFGIDTSSFHVVRVCCL